MTINDIQKDMVAAMKEHNSVKKEVLSSIIATAKNMAIEKKCKDNIPENIVMEAILKAKKVCQEQIDTCPAARTDKMAEYQESMKYIDMYAPKMMAEADVRTFIETYMTANEIPLNKGAIMKAIMPHLKGKADGKLINKVVMEVLNG